MLLQKTNFQFFTSTFDISQTNKARKLRLGSKEAPRNSLFGPHVVFKFSLRKSSQNMRSNVLFFSWYFDASFTLTLQ